MASSKKASQILLALCASCFSASTAARLSSSNAVVTRDHVPYVFFTDADGLNCTYVEPQDPSWGSKCEGHSNFPKFPVSVETGISSREEDADPPPKPWTIDKYNAAVGSVTALTGIDGLVLMAIINWSRITSVFRDDTPTGPYAAQCISNVPGTYEYTNADGETRYAYYCLGKSAPSSANCQYDISESEVAKGFELAQNFLRTSHKKALAACLEFSLEENVSIRGRFVVSTTSSPNLAPCSITCGSYQEIGT